MTEAGEASKVADRCCAVVGVVAHASAAKPAASVHLLF